MGRGIDDGDDMNDTSKGAVGAGKPSAAPSRGAITPAAALARHIEWLEFALAAATSEESWRVARLEKATKKSRDKRTSRLAEVREEIAELTALIAAIHRLQAAKAATTRRSTTTRRRTTTAAGAAAKPKVASGTPRRRRAPGSATEGQA
jgi:hypothetical protein